MCATFLLPKVYRRYEWEIGLKNIIHAHNSEGVVDIVGSRRQSLLRQNQHSPKGSSGGRTRSICWNQCATHLPFPQTNFGTGK